MLSESLSFKTFIALGVFLTYTTVLATAEIADPQTPFWIKELPAAAALIWYMWYSQCRTIPRMEARHCENLASQREDHKEAIKTLTDSHQVIIEGLTKNFSENLDKFRDTINKK